MESLNWLSPFEKLFGFSPPYQDLRVIGCLCFAANLGVTDKFEARARPCVFLGYPFGFKGYKLYDLHTHKVFHSRDVTFSESTFPFKNASPLAPLAPRASDSVLPSVSPFYGNFDSAPSPSLPSSTLLHSPPPSSLVPSSPTSSNPLSSSQSSSLAPSSPCIAASPSPCTAASPSPVPSSSPSPPFRKSHRVTGPPAWLQDFVCPSHPSKQQQASSTSSHSFTSTTYPLFSFSNLAHLSASYVASLTNVLSTPEPTSYAQAKQFPEWVHAMDLELAALEQNHT